MRVQSNPPSPPRVNNNSSTNSSTSLFTVQDAKNAAVLLPTAKATVHEASNESNSCNIRIVLDSCSQKFYVSSRVRYKLNLQTISTDQVWIKEFGNEHENSKQCERV